MQCVTFQPSYKHPRILLAENIDAAAKSMRSMTIIDETATVSVARAGSQCEKTKTRHI